MSDKKTKDLSIETLRGLAILLVVAGYIIKDDLSRGTEHSILSSALHFIYYLFTPIRMPLFTVISAYLYASSPATRETFKKLVTGKARRVMIPFAIVSAVQYIIFTLIPVNGPQTLHNIYQVYILPYEQLWFLYSIFWIFILVGIMDAARMMETSRKWLVCLVISLILHVMLHPTRLFSISGVNYLFPFFLMGYGIKRFSKELFSPPMIRAYFSTSVLAYIIYIGLYTWGALASSVPPALHRYAGLSITFSAVPLIFYFRRSAPFLAKIGSYAFGIHLFNKIGLIPIKALFIYLGIKNDAVIFMSYLIGSVAFAIGIQIMLEQFIFTRKYILGMKEPVTQKLASTKLWPIPVFGLGVSFNLHSTAVSMIILGLFGSLFLMPKQATANVAGVWNRVLCRATGACEREKLGTQCSFICGHCKSGVCRHMPPNTIKTLAMGKL